MDDWKEQYSDDPEVVIGWIKAVYLMSDGDWCDCVRRVAAARDKEITRLRAELAEAQRDAERYRAIRYAIAHNIDPDYQGVMNDGISVSERMEDLDKVADGLKVKVDAAIAAKEE